MSARAHIAMSEAEISSFLDEQRVVICATLGPRGWPHLMPLWYVVRQGEVWAWTYAKSQKVRNLERDARATLELEAGVGYGELRGVMIEALTVLHRDGETVHELGLELMQRYADGASSEEGAAAVRAQVPKRVALQFQPRRISSWDHRKLGA